jgi:hypothetical protein
MRGAYIFWWGNVKERDHLEDLDIDGRIISNMDLQEMGWGRLDWTDLAQDRKE